MNGERYQRYEDEAGISIVDMLFYILGKWRALIIFLIVGLLLGCGMYVMQSSKQASNQESDSGTVAEVLTLSSDTDEALAQLEAKLSSDSLDDLAVAYQYRQKYEEVESYIYSSMYMLLDADGFYRGVLQYYISDSEYTTLISYMYQAIYYEEGLWEELAEASGLDCDPETLYEIFSIGITPSDSVAHEEPGYRVVAFTINAPDEASCTGMMDLIRSKVEAVEDSARSEYGDFSVTVLADDINLVTDDAYLGTQNTYTGYLDTYHTKYVTYEAAFTAVEAAYYKIAYLGVSPESIGTVSTAVVTEETEEEEETETSSGVSAGLWPVLLTVVALVAWLIVYALKYLTDKHVREISEISKAWHISVIGRLEIAGRKKHGPDAWIKYFYDKHRGHADSIEYVVASIKSLDADGIVVGGDTDDASVNEYLRDSLSAAGKVGIVGWAGSDEDALDAAMEAGTEIIFVRERHTVRRDVSREIECCRLHGVKVAGIICV